MAINKNDYLDGNGNYDLKKALIDDLINEFDMKAGKSRSSNYTATLQNGWTGTLHYMKNDVGIVTVTGYIIPGIKATETVIATLPEGYRPLIIAHPFVVTNTVTKLIEAGFTVESNGDIKLRKTFLDQALSLHTTFQGPEVA